MPSAEPDKPKFLQLRDIIRDQILAGVFQDGQTLPTEADLCERHRVSRVTVRKALDELKRERIITSIQGSGTLVTLRRDAFQGALDMVVLVAPVYDRFFSSFFAHFEATVDRNGTIVIFKQDTAHTVMGSAEFYGRFLQRGIRDFVLWPGRGFEGEALLPRLRGLGINVVFFDHRLDSAYADSVGLDDRHAIEGLYDDLRRGRGCRRVDFLGWDDVPLSTTTERERAFRAVAGEGERVFLISKYQGEPFAGRVEALIEDLRRARDLPGGFVCLNGDLGAAAAVALARRGVEGVAVACVDEIAPVAGVPVTCLLQPTKKMAERVFQCLADQNRLGKRWAAGRYLVKGALKRLD